MDETICTKQNNPELFERWIYLSVLRSINNTNWNYNSTNIYLISPLYPKYNELHLLLSDVKTLTGSTYVNC